MKYLSINSRSRQIASQSCIAAALPDHQRQTYACVRVGGSVWVCAAAWEASDSLIRQIRRIYLEICKVIAKGRRRTSAVELAAKRPVNWVHCGHKNVIAASATVCVSPSACACACVRVCGAVHTTWPGKSERVFFSAILCCHSWKKCISRQLGESSAADHPSFTSSPPNVE